MAGDLGVGPVRDIGLLDAAAIGRRLSSMAARPTPTWTPRQRSCSSRSCATTPSWTATRPGCGRPVARRCRGRSGHRVARRKGPTAGAAGPGDAPCRDVPDVRHGARADHAARKSAAADRRWRVRAEETQYSSLPQSCWPARCRRWLRSRPGTPRRHVGVLSDRTPVRRSAAGGRADGVGNRQERVKMHGAEAWRWLAGCVRNGAAESISPWGGTRHPARGLGTGSRRRRPRSLDGAPARSRTLRRPTHRSTGPSGGLGGGHRMSHRA